MRSLRWMDSARRTHSRQNCIRGWTNIVLENRQCDLNEYKTNTFSRNYNKRKISYLRYDIKWCSKCLCLYIYWLNLAKYTILCAFDELVVDVSVNLFVCTVYSVFAFKRVGICPIMLVTSDINGSSNLLQESSPPLYLWIIIAKLNMHAKTRHFVATLIKHACNYLRDNTVVSRT